MSFTQRTRGIVRAIAIVLSLAVPLVMAISAADARIGGGGSSGSRGTRTFSAPPSTSTAPGTAQPFNRTFTQPGSPGMGTAAAATGGGFFNRGGMGRGLLGGLAAGPSAPYRHAVGTDILDSAAYRRSSACCWSA